MNLGTVLERGKDKILAMRAIVRICLVRMTAWDLLPGIYCFGFTAWDTGCCARPLTLFIMINTMRPSDWSLYLYFSTSEQ